jgi:hypothetical protein
LAIRIQKQSSTTQPYTFLVAAINTRSIKQIKIAK